MCSLAFVQADLIAYAGAETLLASSAGGEKEKELGMRRSAGDEKEFQAEKHERQKSEIGETTVKKRERRKIQRGNSGTRKARETKKSGKQDCHAMRMSRSVTTLIEGLLKERVSYNRFNT